MSWVPRVLGLVVSVTCDRGVVKSFVIESSPPPTFSLYKAERAPMRLERRGVDRLQAARLHLTHFDLRIKRLTSRDRWSCCCFGQPHQSQDSHIPRPNS